MWESRSSRTPGEGKGEAAVSSARARLPLLVPPGRSGVSVADWARSPSGLLSWAGGRSCEPGEEVDDYAWFSVRCGWLQETARALTVCPRVPLSPLTEFAPAGETVGSCCKSTTRKLELIDARLPDSHPALPIRRGRTLLRRGAICQLTWPRFSSQRDRQFAPFEGVRMPTRGGCPSGV
jgi:hypothetical protein